MADYEMIQDSEISLIKKPLYNRSFRDVVEQTKTPEKIFVLTSEQLCLSAKDIYDMAQNANRGGDEELAFTLSMQYLNIIDLVQSKSDFRSKHAELSAMFGGMECYIHALNTASLLQKSLIARFNERDSSKKPSSMAKVKSRKQSKSSSDGEISGLYNRKELQLMRERLLDHKILTEHFIWNSVMELKNENSLTRRKENFERINCERIALEKKQEEFQQMKSKYDRLEQQLRAEEAAVEQRIAEKEAKENEMRAKRTAELEKIYADIMKVHVRGISEATVIDGSVNGENK